MKRLLLAAVMVTAAACGSQEVVGSSTPTTPPGTSATTSTTAITPLLPAGTQRSLLTQARATWLANRPDSYAMTYAIGCECDGGPWVVRVDGETTVDAGRVDLGPGRDAPYGSVDAIFDEIEAVLDEGDFPVNAEYDANYGYPRSYIFNEPELPVDGGFTVRLTDFEANPGSTDPEQSRAFDQALLEWKNAGITTYDYIFTRGCFCPEEFVGPYAVSVRNGEVAGATFKGTDLFDIGILEIGRYDEIIKTVDGVFAEIERALREADTFTAEYHPLLGYPTNVYIDWIANAADEEVSYTIKNLRDPGAYPESCSTEGWEAELLDQPDLPPPVADTRRALFDAAMSCDFALVATVSDAADLPVQTSHGGSGPEYIWESEIDGVPVMRTIVEHLNLPYAESDSELGTIYVWPSAMDNLTSAQGDGLSAEEYEALLELYSIEALQEMFEFFDGYVGFRIVIAADGQWLLALAGD